MHKRAIEVQILSEYNGLIDESWVQNVADSTLFFADPQGNSGANIFITNAETLHDLNFRFRGFDESTDVLSFPQSIDTETEVIFPIFPDEESLGDVVISFNHAKTQAKSHNVPFEQELALLIVHGVLHLLGHDHAEPDETAKMQGLEKIILDDFFARTKS